MKRSSLVTLFVCGLLASAAGAEVVFQADFRGDGGGAGGEKDLVTSGGTASIVGLPGNTASVSTEAPDLGAGPYLRTIVAEGAPSGAPQAAIKIVPLAESNSLNAMFSADGDSPALNGGFDFFFRSNLDVTESSNDHVMRAIDTDNRANGGLQLIFMTQQGAVRLDIDGPTDGVEGSSHFQGNFPFKANTVYHLGVTFSTDKSGLVTARIYGVEGTGAIKTSEEKNVLATGTFFLSKDVVKAGFTGDAFDFGAIYNNNAPKTQDFGRLRIYNAVPEELEALSPAPAAAEPAAEKKE